MEGRFGAGRGQGPKGFTDVMARAATRRSRPTRLTVLHLAPLWFPVSPDAPGGIETFLPVLLRALEERGCHNLLIASGDSRTDAELLPVTPVNLCRQMEDGNASEYVYYEQHQLMLAVACGIDVDVVHSHLGPGGYLLSAVAGVGGRVLHTHHNPVYPDLEWFVGEHPELWFSTVSEFQADKLRRQGARRCRVVPNGIDAAAFRFAPQAREALFFLGRMEEEKGADLAVEVARSLDLPLTLAGPIVEDDFFQRRIEPFLGHGIEYVGVVDHTTKQELFGAAGCVLMPSRVDEGFGMVSVEAMACGTPVVALGRGALPEIIDVGVTGYVSETEDGLSSLVPAALELNRHAVRARATERFDVRRIAEAYLGLYAGIIGEAAAPSAQEPV